MTNPPNPARWPETTGSDCYDWLSATDVVRHALAAYYHTCRKWDREPNDPAAAEGIFRNGRYAFAEDVGNLFTWRLDREGYSRGVPGFDSALTEFLQTHGEYWEPPEKPQGETPGRHIHRAQSNTGTSR